MSGPKIDWDQVSKRATEATAKKDDSPGEEWFSSIEYQENMGVGRSTAHEALRKMCEAGSAEFRRGLANKKWYRITQ